MYVNSRDAEQKAFIRMALIVREVSAQILRLVEKRAAA